MMPRHLLIILLFPLAGCVATPLVKAVKKGDVEAARSLIEGGAEVNEKGGWLSSSFNDPIGLTALHHAAELGQVETARLLLENGADANIRTGVATPLIRAVTQGHADMVRLLIERGARVDNRVRRVARERGYAAILRLVDPDAAAAAPPRGPGTRPDAAPTPAGMPRVLSPSFRHAPAAHDFAVVVGIEEYSDLPEARFAARDARAVVAHMEALGIPRRNIIHLSGARASYTGMKKYLEAWLPKNVRPDSRVFFYFSGHGAPDVKTGETYLVPWNGDPNFLETTAYPLGSLYRSLGKLKAKEVVVALDACFSGRGKKSVIAKGVRAIDVVARPARVKADIVVLSGSRSNEVSTFFPDAGHGLFTYFLLKGLNGEAQDSRGRVTTRGLYDYLKPKVQDEARRQNLDQTPTLHAGSDVVLRSD